MALFFDKIISKKYDTKYPMDCLVHTYNKNYFNNINDAKTMLLNKVLLPGEVAFGYYYDSNASCGSNAIFAVGPLNNTGKNILFKNSDEIDYIVNDLNSYINQVRDDINNELELNREIIQTLVYDACTQLKDISNNIDNFINESNDVLSQLQDYNDRINEILIFNTEIQDNLDDIRDLINIKVNDVSVYLVDLINKAFSGEDSSTAISYYINQFKDEINEKTQNLDLINTSINLLTNNYNYVKNIELINKQKEIDDLKRRVKILEHLIYHVLERPEESYDDIIELIKELILEVDDDKYIFNDLNDISING